jgi:hypothetical protein
LAFYREPARDGAARYRPSENDPMPTTGKITDHEWQDVVCMGLGVLILLSPWVVQDEPTLVVAANAAIVGVLVLLVSELELAGHTVGEEALNGAAGLWLMASPLVLGYRGELMAWHVALGALVAIIAVVEFWQERTGAGGPS